MNRKRSGFHEREFLTFLFSPEEIYVNKIHLPNNQFPVGNQLPLVDVLTDKKLSGNLFSIVFDVLTDNTFLTGKL